MSFDARSPTHLIKVKMRNGNGKATVGAGWANADHSLRIVLNPGAVLRWNDDLFITAFPVNDKDRATAKADKVQTPVPMPEPDEDIPEENIPF